MATVRITTKGLLCVVAAALALLYISFRGRLLLSELQDLLYGCHTDSFWPEKDPSHPSKYGGSGGHRWDIFWNYHDDVIKWKHFPRHWPFVRGIHRWPVNSPQKGRWREALMFSLIYAWTKHLSKQSGCRWFETPSRSLWRQCSDPPVINPRGHHKITGDHELLYGRLEMITGGEFQKIFHLFPPWANVSKAFNWDHFETPQWRHMNVKAVSNHRSTYYLKANSIGVVMKR